MRILFVQKDVFERSVGGNEFYSHHLAGELVKRHDVAVFCTSSKAPVEGQWRPTPPGAPRIFEVRPNYDLYFGSEAERIVRAGFERALDDLSPDLVHFHDLFRFSPELPDIAARRGIPRVLTAHEFYLICPRLILRTSRERLCGGPTALGCASCGHDMALERYSGEAKKAEPRLDRAKRRLKSFLLRRRVEASFALVRRQRFLRAASSTDLVLCPSAFLRDRLRHSGIPAEKLRVLGYGLPVLGPPREKTKSSRPRFGFIGSPAPHKGIFVLLAAAARAPEAEITIYGELPKGVEASVRQAAALAPNVRLGGVLTDDAKRDVYASINVLVTPSIWYENQPITMLEAFHFRTPVVASRLGGMQELLAGGGGWLVPPEDPQALADCLRRLCADPEEIARVAASTPAVKSMADHAVEIESIYAAIAAPGRDRLRSGG